MKKLCGIAICIVIIFTFSGCNEQQKAELQNVINQEIQTEDAYTPNSYQSYLTALEYAEIVKDKTFVSKKEISEAQINLQNAIEQLYVKPDKSNLSQLINKANSLNQNKYTSISCKTLESVITFCESVLKDEDSLQQEVTEAEGKINQAICQLTVAKNGVYRINYSFVMTANFSVGNEWFKSIEYNGKSIRNGQTITAPLNSGITIKGTVIESDSVPDVGSGNVYLLLGGDEKTIEIYVRENRGRYSGNFAIWELTCSATLIERI